MRKIRPGITAIAILMGPAALIIGHQKISEYLSPSEPNNAEPVEVLWQIYHSCSEPTKLQRTVRCDEYVRYLDRCAAMRTCDLRSTYDLLIKLDLSSPPLSPLPSDKVAGTKS
jgi:hypothetical protein